MDDRLPDRTPFRELELRVDWRQARSGSSIGDNWAYHLLRPIPGGNGRLPAWRDCSTEANNQPVFETDDSRPLPRVAIATAVVPARDMDIRA
jgi:hypothetical protein